MDGEICVVRDSSGLRRVEVSDADHERMMRARFRIFVVEWTGEDGERMTGTLYATEPPDPNYLPVIINAMRS